MTQRFSDQLDFTWIVIDITFHCKAKMRSKDLLAAFSRSIVCWWTLGIIALIVTVIGISFYVPISKTSNLYVAADCFLENKELGRRFADLPLICAQQRRHARKAIAPWAKRARRQPRYPSIPRGAVTASPESAHATRQNGSWHIWATIRRSLAFQAQIRRNLRQDWTKLRWVFLRWCRWLDQCEMWLWSL